MSFTGMLRLTVFKRGHKLDRVPWLTTKFAREQERGALVKIDFM